jgi:inner membrane protein
VGRICHDAEPVPSPIGHALAGVATAWSSEHLPAPDGHPPRVSTRLTVVCAVLAALPDIDLLVPNQWLPGFHRSVTHSIGAVLVVTIISAGVTGWVTWKINWRVAMICGAAYASHLVLDWLGVDPNPPFGIQALWPFSHQWFISPITIFPGTERRQFLTLAALTTNLRAIGFEVGAIAPIVALLAWKRRRPGRAQA